MHVFQLSYLIRRAVLSMLGLWHYVFPTYFARWELYMLLSVLSDAPNLFLLYIKHYQVLDVDKTDLPNAEWKGSNYSAKSLMVIMTEMDTDFASEYRQR